MTEEPTVHLLNTFFEANGDKAIFFYLPRGAAEASMMPKQIGIATSSTGRLADVLNNIQSCVFFIRDCQREVQVNTKFFLKPQAAHCIHMLLFSRLKLYLQIFLVN